MPPASIYCIDNRHLLTTDAPDATATVASTNTHKYTTQKFGFWSGFLLDSDREKLWTNDDYVDVGKTCYNHYVTDQHQNIIITLAAVMKAQEHSNPVVYCVMLANQKDIQEYTFCIRLAYTPKTNPDKSQWTAKIAFWPSREPTTNTNEKEVNQMCIPSYIFYNWKAESTPIVFLQQKYYYDNVTHLSNWTDDQLQDMAQQTYAAYDFTDECELKYSCQTENNNQFCLLTSKTIPKGFCMMLRYAEARNRMMIHLSFLEDDKPPVTDRSFMQKIPYTLYAQWTELLSASSDFLQVIEATVQVAEPDATRTSSKSDPQHTMAQYFMKSREQIKCDMGTLTWPTQLTTEWTTEHLRILGTWCLEKLFGEHTDALEMKATVHAQDNISIKFSTERINFIIRLRWGTNLFHKTAWSAEVFMSKTKTKEVSRKKSADAENGHQECLDCFWESDENMPCDEATYAFLNEKVAGATEEASKVTYWKFPRENDEPGQFWHHLVGDYLRESNAGRGDSELQERLTRLVHVMTIRVFGLNYDHTTAQTSYNYQPAEHNFTDDEHCHVIFKLVQGQSEIYVCVPCEDSEGNCIQPGVCTRSTKEEALAVSDVGHSVAVRRLPPAAAGNRGSAQGSRAQRHSSAVAAEQRQSQQEQRGRPQRGR